MKLMSSDSLKESDEYLVWKMKSKAKNNNIPGWEIPENTEALPKIL